MNSSLWPDENAKRCIGLPCWVYDETDDFLIFAVLSKLFQPPLQNPHQELGNNVARHLYGMTNPLGFNVRFIFVNDFRRSGGPAVAEKHTKRNCGSDIFPPCVKIGAKTVCSIHFYYEGKPIVGSIKLVRGLRKL